MSYRSAVGAALAVAAAAVAVAGIGTPAQVPVAVPAASVVPVTAANLDCPDLPARADTTLLAAAPAVAAPTGPAAGTLRVHSVQTRTAAPPLARLNHPGLLQRTVAAADGTALVVSASGGLAPGTAAALAATGRGHQVAGLSVGSCAAPTRSWWFAGVDTRAGRTSRLTLTNPSAASAVVDLALFAPGGPVDASGLRGIAIPGQSQRSLDLASFAPGVDALTVHVSAAQGSVSAAVRTVALSGLTAVGADWISPAAPPSPSFVLGPAAASTGRQLLVLTNPSSREALGGIQIVDATGAFTPTKLASVRIGPGAVVVTDLTALLGGQPAAVRISANVALTGAITTIERGRVPDFVTVGATLPLTAPAAVPLVPSTELQLLLTTDDRAGAVVHVDVFDRAGDRVRRQQVAVSGRTTRSWDLGTRDPGAYLLVTPTSGAAVHAVAYFRSRYGVAALPVASAEWSIRLPVVEPAP